MARLTDQHITAIRNAWCRETSADPENWTPENPAWGQCAVTALLVQDIIGGELVRVQLPYCGSHYFGIAPGAGAVDLTFDQFNHLSPSPALDIVFAAPTLRDREYVLSFPATAERYRRLKGLVYRGLRTTAEQTRLVCEPA